MIVIDVKNADWIFLIIFKNVWNKRKKENCLSEITSDKVVPAFSVSATYIILISEEAEFDSLQEYEKPLLKTGMP